MPIGSEPRGRLQGRTALVTGGSSGIGLAVASRFVSEGADVTALSRHYRPEVDDAGAHFMAADTSEPEQMRAALEDAAERAGPLHVLVLNAGIASLDASRLEHTDLRAVERLVRVNTMGVLHGLAAMPPYLQDGASVIITASAASRGHSPDTWVTACRRRPCTRWPATPP